MAEREKVIDFTVPIYDPVGFTVLMKKFKKETNLFMFLSVLEDVVWGTVLAAYFGTSVLLWVFDRYITSNNIIIWTWTCSQYSQTLT